MLVWLVVSLHKLFVLTKFYCCMHACVRACVRVCVCVCVHEGGGGGGGGGTSTMHLGTIIISVAQHFTKVEV